MYGEHESSAKTEHGIESKQVGREVRGIAHGGVLQVNDLVGGPLELTAQLTEVAYLPVALIEKMERAAGGCGKDTLSVVAYTAALGWICAGDD